MPQLDLANHEIYQQEVRLFLEEVCCHLCRYHHMEKDCIKPEEVRIVPEFSLGHPGSFADVRVETPGGEIYFLEVKYGYPADKIVRHLLRKYGPDVVAVKGARRLILVVDTSDYPDWADIRRRIEAGLNPGLVLDVWDMERLLSMIRLRFNCDVRAVSEANIIGLKDVIDDATGRYAFGGEWTGNALQLTLLWHLSHWRIRQLREQYQLTARSILPPGMYDRVVVLMADLCSFSSYIRDTPEHAVAREALTAFYSKSRYAILNAGGLMYQFVGDEVIGMFGLPRKQDDYLQKALDCAHVLVDIGASVSNEWQKQIDRVQKSQGVHIGMALGDIQVVSLRPFGRAHIGAVSDEINMAARFVGQAGPGEIVISNAYHNLLNDNAQACFQEMEPIEAHNVGHIKLWKENR
jgi:class 3 adenylate cyclase